MLLQPIKLTLYDPKTSEPVGEYSLSVITFEMLLAATQLEEALNASAEKPKRKWWWQKPISGPQQQIQALLELITSFYGHQFTVEQLRSGADISEVMAVLQAIVSRAGSIASANPTPPARSRGR